jgi:two-component system, NarL family, response regulator DevR
MKLGAKPRVLLADDYVPLQSALKRLLEPECELVGRAATVSELLAEAHRCHPDVVVVDLLLTESNGIDACRQLKAALPAISIVMLTALDDADVRQAALAAGASDFVSKDSADRRLLPAIRNAWCEE